MKNGYRGFITVEYAFILPTIILLILTMISMALYLYNGCLLQQNTCLIALKLRNAIGVEENVDYQGIYDGLYHNKYLLAYDIDSVVTLNNHKISIVSQGSVVPLGVEKIFTGEELMQITSNVIVSERNNYLLLHTMKQLKTIGAEVLD